MPTGRSSTKARLTVPPTEPYVLAEVEPGQTVTYSYGVGAPETLSEQHRGEQARVRWTFYVTDQEDITTKDDGTTTGSKRPGWLPKTGDGAYIAAGVTVCALCAAGLLLAVSAKRRRNAVQDAENEL